MKKTSITIRVPIFFDVDVELEDSDYEILLDEWDLSNFGRVKTILGEYVDLENLDIIGAEERFGEPEIVDIRTFEKINIIECDDFEEEEKTEEQDEFCFTTIPPKGKLN